MRVGQGSNNNHQLHWYFYLQHNERERERERERETDRETESCFMKIFFLARRHKCMISTNVEIATATVIH